MIYEVFAVSEEGTETVFSTDNLDEALNKRLELQNSLENKKWSNTTSLNNVVGFNVDEGPDGKTIETY
jgi:hypothetical protein